MDDKFVQWATEHPVAHIQSAHAAWKFKQREVSFLTAHIIALEEKCAHLEQQVFEAEQRKLRLVHSAA